MAEEELQEPSEAALVSEQPTDLVLDGEAPSVESIRIYLRSRPVHDPSELVEYDQHERQLTLHVPKEASTGYALQCCRCCCCCCCTQAQPTHASCAGM